MVTFGGKAFQRFSAKASDVESQVSVTEAIAAAVSVSVKISSLFGSSESSLNVEKNRETEQDTRSRVQRSSTSRSEVFIGGDPGLGDFSDGGTDGLKSWALSVADNPVPVNYELSPCVLALASATFSGRSCYP